MERVTLDQLRVFVAVAETGSFSAAARGLDRVQSAVSQAVANAEGRLGVDLFDRSHRRPQLTAHGKTLLTEARRVLAAADGLHAQAHGMQAGLEPSVSIVCDAIFPMDPFVRLCRAFAERFPNVPLRVGSETLGAVSARVLDGAYDLGLVGSGAPDLPKLTREHVGTVRMIPVAAPDHPLARLAEPIAAGEVRGHVQIVLSERTAGTGEDIAVMSERTWRVVDLRTKHALLRGGLGWGNLPEPMVEDDLARGTLVKLALAAWGPDEFLLSLAAIYRSDRAPGVAGRWLLDNLPALVPAPPPAVSRTGARGTRRGGRRPRTRPR